MSNKSVHQDVFITKQNPFYKLLTNNSLVVALGSSPVISIIIAIDSDGTRSQQDNATNSLVFTHTSNNGDVVNVDGLEQDPVNFQLYHYTFPPVQRSSVGTYTITSDLRSLQSLEVEEELKSLRVELRVNKFLGFSLKRSFSSVTLLEGDSITLSCTPSLMEVVVLWAHNRTTITNREDIMYTPPGLNHSLTIEKTNTNDTGRYRCRVAIDDTQIMKFINLTVVRACGKDFSEGLFWNRSRLDSTVTQPCSTLHPSFRSGVNIKRQCLRSGNWSSVDLRDCTMFRDALPVVTLSFTVSYADNGTDPTAIIINQVLSELNSSILRDKIKAYSHLSAVGSKLMSFLVSFNLHATIFSADLVEDIENIFVGNGSSRFHSDDMNLFYMNFEISAFQPNSSCPCTTTDDNSLRIVCTGPSTPPCLCNSSQCCTCNSPTYVGDGSVCGLDSDSDGFPDVGLDCDQPQCVQDLCPDMYSNISIGETSALFCKQENVSLGCSYEQDDTWNISWPGTKVSEVSIQKCPGGSEAEGLATRKCLGIEQWGDPDVSQCRTVKQIRLETRAKDLANLVHNRFVNDDRDLTQTFMSEVVEDIADELQEITNTTQPLLPNDLSSAANTLGDIIGVANITMKEVDQPLLMNVTEDSVNVLDNLLDDRNNVSYLQINKMHETTTNKTVGEMLLINTEETGVLLSNILDTSGNQTVETTLKGRRNNIVILVKIPTHQELMQKREVTSESNSLSVIGDMAPSFTIPSAVVLRRMTEEGKRNPIISSIARTFYLPTDKGIRVESMMLSIQISTNCSPRIDLGNETVSLLFNLGLPGNGSRFNPRCAFFNLTNKVNQSGRFSTDGIIQKRIRNNTFIQCSTTHLTSFAVLVNASGGVKESQALSIVSYIGCAVSIICLFIATCLFITLRKRVFHLVQHFLHLNLCIALLLGMITFVSGIESANKYRASCLIVAVLLHYFFMAAFSWMLCEGILLFVMLKFVFHASIFRRKFFFLFGWGLPIPIVAISAAVSHDQYGIDNKCWLSENNGAIWSFIGPMLLIILVNIFFLTFAIYEVYKSSRTMTTKEPNAINIAKSSLKTAIVLVPMLGCTWVFGLFAINDDTVAFAWIFTILNSLQGLFILVFYVLKTEKFLAYVRRSAEISSYSCTISPKFLNLSKKDSARKEHRQVDTTNQLNAPNAADGNISTHEQNFSLSSPMTPPNTHNYDGIAEAADSSFNEVSSTKRNSQTLQHKEEEYVDAIRETDV